MDTQMEVQLMNADQVPVLDFICPRFWIEQAKMEIYEKNGQKWQFFQICDKIKGINGAITT